MVWSRGTMMKTLDIHKSDLKEISNLVEQFINTNERPIQIITDHELYSKRKKTVRDILGRERRRGKMKYYCLYNTPYVTWRIYK